MKKHLPRVLMAAPKSGSGKTLITCGLINYLKKKQHNVISYKCGPDYIDPMFHRKVLGIGGGNLDSYFQDEQGLIRTLVSGNGECAVLEGVMGIFDGLELTGLRASSYEVASLTKTPVILVVDGKGAGRTLISTINGILADDESRIIKGIIINNINRIYYERLVPVLNERLINEGYNIKLLGYVPKLKEICIDSRHLGLKMPDEINDINRQIDMVSDAIEEGCDIKGLLEIMESAEDLLGEPIKCMVERQSLRLAVARDDAFCFYYKENLELLASKGIELVEFSPLDDTSIPDNVDGILLGGGYPENYLDKLSKNISMLDSIRRIIKDGIPCLAECGGFMYLHDTVEDVNGNAFTLAGIIDGKCYYTGHLVRFGYIELSHDINDTKEQLSDNINHMRGHEFHYYDSTNNGQALTATKPSGEREWKTIIANENQMFGFPHLFYPSNPEFVDAFILKMKAYHDRRQ